MGRKEGGTRGTGWEKRRNMAWWVRGGGRIISDRARLAEFSSMFHPPSAHTLRSLTLSRPQFVCINAQPRDTVRRRNESGRSGKSRGNSTRRCVPSSKGWWEFSRQRYLAPFSPSTRLFSFSSSAFYGGETTTNSEDIVSNRAVNFFTRSLLVSGPRREALKRAS